MTLTFIVSYSPSKRRTGNLSVRTETVRHRETVRKADKDPELFFIFNLTEYFTSATNTASTAGSHAVLRPIHNTTHLNLT